MKLSVIIPAYNEEKRIAKTLEEIREYLKDFDHELIVVDDGSSDGTSAFSHLTYKQNMGKGYAIKKGVEIANGDLILFIDADNATPIEELTKFLKIDADIIIGSRYLPESRIERKQSHLRILIGRLGNLIISLLVIKNIKDTQCGFKLFKKTVAKELFSELQTYRFGFDIEILARAQKKHMKIVEVPVTWLHNNNSRVRPIRDALKTLLDLIKIWWRLTFPHKVV
ncbi:MAG: dolichyl-phosphate beta-glucosyltransferase [Patescibacteria group bacterium]